MWPQLSCMNAKGYLFSDFFLKNGNRICINSLAGWARHNWLASRQPQHDNVIELQWQEKIRKMLSYRCLMGAATTNMYIVYRHNAIANRLFGLKTWSRCRGSVAVCPSLLFGYTQNRYQFIRSSMQETCSGKLRHNKNILNNNYIISFNKCQPLF